MTNEYEQAVNLIKAFLIDFDCETGDTDYIEPDDLQALYEQGARRLLALTHPSGQRVLAVLAKDQTLPQYNPVDAANSEFTYPDAYMHSQSDMFRAGFRRAVSSSSSPYMDTWNTRVRRSAGL